MQAVEQKIRTMPTDPARVKRTDPGTPEKCPVWDFHQVYSDTPMQAWVQQGCRTAGIGCLDCKCGLLEGLQKELAGFRERAQEFEENPALVRDILAKGSAAARKAAQDTLVEVWQAMGLTGY